MISLFLVISISKCLEEFLTDDMYTHGGLIAAYTQLYIQRLLRNGTYRSTVSIRMTCTRLMSGNEYYSHGEQRDTKDKEWKGNVSRLEEEM